MGRQLARPLRDPGAASLARAKPRVVPRAVEMPFRPISGLEKIAVQLLPATFSATGAVGFQPRGHPLGAAAVIRKRQEKSFEMRAESIEPTVPAGAVSFTFCSERQGSEIPSGEQAAQAERASKREAIVGHQLQN